jgi:hypothetical protein
MSIKDEIQTKLEGIQASIEEVQDSIEGVQESIAQYDLTTGDKEVDPKAHLPYYFLADVEIMEGTNGYNRHIVETGADTHDEALRAVVDYVIRVHPKAKRVSIKLRDTPEKA